MQLIWPAVTPLASLSCQLHPGSVLPWCCAGVKLALSNLLGSLGIYAALATPVAILLGLAFNFGASMLRSTSPYWLLAQQHLLRLRTLLDLYRLANKRALIGHHCSPCCMLISDPVICSMADKLGSAALAAVALGPVGHAVARRAAGRAAAAALARHRDRLFLCQTSGVCLRSGKIYTFCPRETSERFRRLFQKSFYTIPCGGGTASCSALCQVDVSCITPISIAATECGCHPCVYTTTGSPQLDACQYLPWVVCSCFLVSGDGTVFCARR